MGYREEWRAPRTPPVRRQVTPAQFSVRRSDSHPHPYVNSCLHKPMLAYSMVSHKAYRHNSRITHWMDRTVANWWMP